MNPGRFYMPRIGTNFSPMMGASYLTTRGNIGLFSRITSSLRSFNWSGFLNGANKTLNVINQSIPLVRQAGPMLNNMKSMLRIARAFGSETNNRTNFNTNVNNNTNFKNNNVNSNISDYTKTINNTVRNNNETPLRNTIANEMNDDSYPNFFV